MAEQVISDRTHRVTITVSDGLLRAVRAEADRLGVSVSLAARMAIQTGLQVDRYGRPTFRDSAP